MLTECANVQQRRGEPRRRWFHSDEQDLILWLGDDGTILGFQLCYRCLGSEHALTWFEDRGYSHHKVDDGEENPPIYKRTPTLVSDGAFDSQAVLQRFQSEANELSPELVAFVTAKLEAYPHKW